MNKARLVSFIFAGIAIAMLPSISSAQSSIAGTVKDASGAVVAGAKVQVSSEAIIEGTKSATTNGDGRYEIIDLRPGTYVVTATSSGFDTVRQTIVVPANVTVPVDATLKVGSVGETVTVETRVATVDTENATHATTLTRQEMDDLPTGRYMQSIASYTPGAHLNVPDIGGSQQVEQNYISVHGNSSTQDQYVLDGMKVNTTYADGAIQNYIDNSAIQESTYQTSGVTAEVSGGGMLSNLVPRDGGNQFHTDVFLSGSNGTGIWQANNLNASTLARNLSQQDKIVKIEDFDGSFSGPMIKNKLWFVLTGRDQQTFTQAGASQYPNGAPGIQDGHLYNGTFRLTYQINQKNKWSAFYERNFKYKGHEILDGGATFPADPSVSSQQRSKWPMYYILQTRWTGTPTPKLVVQVGVSIDHLDYNDVYQDGITQAEGTPGFFAKTGQYDAGTLRIYTAGSGDNQFQTTRNDFNAQATYVTGNHQVKAGFEFSNGRNDHSLYLNGDGIENFVNGVPFSFTAYNTPYVYKTHLDGDMGIYGMDTWKFKRVSITAGIRYEYLGAEINPINEPNGRFAPARTAPDINCNTIKGMGCWNNWTPRVGIVYDVFGNHKTAVKASFGKYNNQYSTGFTNTFNPVGTQTETVPWNFAGLGAACTPITFEGLAAPNPLCFASGGFAPQGTVGLTGVAPGGLGASPNPTFGAVAASTGIALDPNWHRDYSYQYSAGVQQQLLNGITLNVNWFRRSAYQGVLLLNQNAIPLSQWTPFTIDNPLNGTAVTVFNLNPAITTQPKASLYQTNAPQSLVRDVYTGFESQVTARLRRGTFVTFGWTLERQLARGCADGVSVGKPLQDPNNFRYCDNFGDPNLSYEGININGLGAVSPPWANNFVANGSVPIRWGIVASSSFLSNNYAGNQGDAFNGYLARSISISSARTSVYPNGCVGCQNSLPTGGTCATAGPTVGCPIDPGFNSLQGSETVQLVAPGKVRTDRLNQWDISLKRTFRIKERWTLEPEFQMFNLLNSAAVIAQSTSISPSAAAGTSGVAPFLTPQQCAGSTVGSFAQCGMGGTIQTLTTPRLMKLALIIKF